MTLLPAASQIVNTNKSIKLPSFAKINWTLQVLGKRPDAFHEIFTVLQTVSLHDELTLVSRDDGQLRVSCNDPSVPLDQANLVWRAASALRERTGVSRGVDLVLHKQIPAQAGLGGGSSNAAITLFGLNWLWDCGLGTEDLLAIAGTIGSDVPFFLIGGTALAEGKGTKLEGFPDVPETHLIIVLPNARVSTKEAYRLLNRPSLTTLNSTSILARSFAASDLTDRAQWPLKNDFEDVIFEIEPELKRAKQALLDSGARGALLAGSGSSVFGIFADEPSRQRALGEIEIETGWRVFSCTTISRDEYFAALEPSL